MIPSDMEDFLKGYTDAEEKLLDVNYDVEKALASLASTVEQYEMGFRLYLKEYLECIEYMTENTAIMKKLAADYEEYLECIK